MRESIDVARRAGSRAPDSRAVAAGEVSSLFESLVTRLGDWRDAILDGGVLTPSALDDRVAALVLPELEAEDPLLVGAGFIASPAFAGTPGVQFAWWLGPLDDNPVFGATTRATRLDLGTRNYADYLRDFRALEWYSIPESTHQTHITGPYVDHLCACDYIVTVTAPVERDGDMIGVVGVDVYVKRLERELLPVLLALPDPAALVNESGRVVVSTDPTVPAGAVLGDAHADALRCAGTPFRLVLTSHFR